MRERMAETLLVFQSPVPGPDGTAYEARACGSEMPAGGWQGWLEFVPLRSGAPVRSQRETTQPNRVDTEYWATGLTPVYLEGALMRALTRPPVVPVAPPQPSVFRGPVSSLTKRATEVSPASVLNPFSVYEKGEALLRSQLGALSAWHLVNIAIEYELSDEPVERLNRLSAPNLIELIVKGVREELPHHRPA
jgi:hypothetical protein